MLIVLALARGELVVPHASIRAWIALAYMGTLGTALAFVWFLEGVKALGPGRAAIFVNLVPVAAITLAVMLLDEELTTAMMIGLSRVERAVERARPMPGQAKMASVMSAPPSRVPKAIPR